MGSPFAFDPPVASAPVPARPAVAHAAADVAATGVVAQSERLRVLVVGGPARLVASMPELMAATPGAQAIDFAPVENSPEGLERLEAGAADAVVVFDDLTGRVMLRGVAERGLEVPAVCIIERADPKTRAAQRARLRGQGAWSCVFADDLTGPLLEAAVLQAVEMRRVVTAVECGSHAASSSIGILGRSALVRRLGAAIAQAEVDAAYRYTVVWCDASPLRSLLSVDPDARRLFGERLWAAAGQHAAGRLGEDEFAILIEGVQDADDLHVIAAVRNAAAQAFGPSDEPIYIDVAIGVARGKARDRSPDAAVERARATATTAGMPSAESAALSGSHVAAAVAACSGLEDALRLGLDRGEFAVSYQPIVDLHRGKLRGFEALIRWNHPDGGERTAADFIPTAERSELIIGLGYWVLEAAVRQMAQWEQEFDLDGAVVMSINLSPRQVTDPLLLDRVSSMLMTTGLTPRGLCFEIQSESVMTSTQEASDLILGLHALGAKVWIEDFGQSDCDVDHLRGLPVAGLKIDRQLVSRIDGTEMTSGRVKHIIDAAKAMRAQVIAAGVENELQANVLRWLGCTVGQGYLHARPMPVGDAYAYLARHL